MRLVVTDLSVSYSGAPPVVHGVAFTVGAGEIVGVVGPNGAGKSTMLKAVVGLLRADRGSVRLDGEPVTTRRRAIAYLPQRSAVDWNYPAVVREVVAMGRYPHVRRLRTMRDHDRACVRAALDQVGLAGLGDRPIGDLSGGQQQRMLLARALAQEAQVLLLDEPFAGVDAVTEQLLRDQLRRLRDAGAAVVVVNHDLTAVSELYDQLLVLSGRMVAFGPLEEVFTADVIREAYGAAPRALRFGSAP